MGVGGRLRRVDPLPGERIPRKISRIEPLNQAAVVGRVTPCAPGLVNNGGAHGVRLSQNLEFGGTSYTSP